MRGVHQTHCLECNGVHYPREPTRIDANMDSNMPSDARFTRLECMHTCPLSSTRMASTHTHTHTLLPNEWHESTLARKNARINGRSKLLESWHPCTLAAAFVTTVVGTHTMCHVS